jgi:hypothetical protein
MLMVALFSSLLQLALGATPAIIPLAYSPPQNASKPILESFVSFSIEFSSFPDFAGKQASSFVDGKLSNLDTIPIHEPEKAWS